MIKSMTGFGKGEAICGNKKFRVELRSLNSKQLDLSVKIPGKYRAAEAEVRNLVSRMLQRGKVECFVSYEAQVVETSVHINREAFKAYVEELRSVCGENGVVAEGDALLHSVMRMPDVVTSEDQEVGDDELKAIVDATQQAAEQLDAFRVQEGAILIADLLTRIDLIQKYRHDVEPLRHSE